MRAKLANLNNCAVLCFSRAAVNLSFCTMVQLELVRWYNLSWYDTAVNLSWYDTAVNLSWYDGTKSCCPVNISIFLLESPQHYLQLNGERALCGLSGFFLFVIALIVSMTTEDILGIISCYIYFSQK